MTVNELQRMKEVEAANAKLKRMYADLAHENAAIKDSLCRQTVGVVRDLDGKLLKQ